MKKTVLHAALLALTAPISVYGLGLGKMTVASALDQPFSAEIELVDVGSVLLKDVKVGVADPENFTQIGLERTAVLSLLTFAIVKNEHGKEVIKVQSTERIPDPYMELVVDLTWPAGQLYKAYTVLLDPPGYHLVSTTIQGSRTHYIHQTRHSSEPGVINKTVVTSITSNPMPVSDSKKQSTYGPTLSNESVWQIAQRYKASDTILPQVVLAIVGENPSAFTDGNLNGLKAGVKLTIPATTEIKQVPAELATSEAMAHDKAWNDKTPIDHVLSPPYISGQAVEKNTTSSESSTHSGAIAPVAIPSTIPQLITKGASPLTNNPPVVQHPIPQSVESRSSSKAEVSIAAAAIESVREANALLMEQLRIVQKQNDKLQKQLEQRNKELKELRSQVQLLIKQRQSLPSQTRSTESGDIISLWPFLLLFLLAGGGAYWYLKIRAQKKSDVTDAIIPQVSIEPASFIAPREDENIEKPRAIDERERNNGLIVTEQSKNTVSESPLEIKKEDEEVLVLKNTVEQIAEEVIVQQEPFENTEELSLDDKDVDYSLPAESLVKEEEETVQREPPTEIEPLEFTPMEPLSSNQEEVKEHAFSIDEEKTPSDEKIEEEGGEEQYLEFESGLHKSLSPLEETPVREDIIDEHTNEGIDFSPSLEPNVEKRPNIKEEVNLDIEEELQQFFVEENTKEEQEHSTTTEDLASDLLKSDKALDTLLALAKTYISMDDIESARVSLNEILEQGNQKQKDEALSLLESIKRK